jgi:sugar transferase (PEP-CTERM/EpsH1 system associated)
VAEKRPLHILHVVRAGRAAGGMETGIVNVANALPSDRFRISICALDTRQTFSERINRSDAEYHLLPKTSAGIEWGLVPRLAQLIRRTRVDLVHSHNWGSFLYSVLAAKWAGVPIVHGEHGKNLGELNETNRAKVWTKRLLGRRIDRLVTVSQSLADEWAAYGVPLQKIEWIPNGVDTERFRPRGEKPELRRKFGLPERDFVVGSVGRFDPIKNYAVLVEAFALLALAFPGSRLAFLGDGQQESDLRETAKRLGVSDRISWLGRRSDPQDFLPALDVFVLPSLSEGMSNVVLEAMASGMPVICADLPAHREVYQPGQEGVTISPCDPQTLSEAIAALLCDADRRVSLGAAARARVLAQFDLRCMISRYESLYSRYLVGESMGAAARPIEQA